MKIVFNKTANNIENFLSKVSRYPVVGTIAGSVKVVLGTVQFTIAIIALILTGLAYIFTRNSNPVMYAYSHIAHGIGNVGAGLVELTPILQTLFYKLRYLPEQKPFYFSTGRETKYMPYDFPDQILMQNSFIGQFGKKSNSYTIRLKGLVYGPYEPYLRYHADDHEAEASLNKAHKSFSDFEHYVKTHFIPKISR